MRQDETSPPNSGSPLPEPRATLGQRMGAAAYVLGFAAGGWSGWEQLHRDFTLSHVIGWALIAGSLLFAPRFAWVVLTGRMSRTLRRNLDPASYRMTFSQTLARTRRDLDEERKRTREM